MSEPTLILVLAAGIVSFLSPCMLPVIPTFLAQFIGIHRPEFEKDPASVERAVGEVGIQLSRRPR